MAKDDNTLNGTLTGVALAAAAHWARYDDGTQRSLRNVRADAEEALDRIRDLQSRGEALRSRLPVVMDAQVGIALASPQTTAAAVIPSTNPLTRPDLTTQMESAISEMSWPPEPGQYDERGLVKQAGELTAMFLAMTYEEVRAFVQGLAQARPPSADCKMQTYYAANALVAQLCAQKLTWQQYKDAWARLFGGGGVSGPVTTVEPHSNPALPPQIQGPLGSNVQSVVPLNNLNVAGAYANPNTDKAMRFRVTAGAGNVNALSPIASVRFGSEFKYRTADGVLVPFQPVVVASSRQSSFFIDSVTSTGFTICSNQQIPTNQSQDVYIATLSGVATEV